MQELLEVIPRPESEYLLNLGFEAAIERTAHTHPFLADMIDRSDPRAIRACIDEMNRISWEFETADSGGRAIAYNIAQKTVGNRGAGMATLLRLFSASGTGMPDARCIVLDALAGDGTLSRFAATLPVRPTILSADLSAYMIERCAQQGLPCLRQSAARSLLKDSVLDGVLIAYGSHHLDAADRRRAAREARRTLKPGGRFVLHDFETGGAVDHWFGQVVHPYSSTGHPHPHFSRAEMHALLGGAGFRDVRVFDMDDPFLIGGATVVEATTAMLRHLYHMYDLRKLSIDSPAGLDDLRRRAAATIGEITVAASPGGWTAHLPRTALVAVGTA